MIQIINRRKLNRNVYNICDVICVKNDYKAKHFRFHINNQILKCEYCNRIFKRQHHFARHLLIYRKHHDVQIDIIVSTKTVYIFNINVFLSQLYLKYATFRKLLKNFRNTHNQRFSKILCFLTKRNELFLTKLWNTIFSSYCDNFCIRYLMKKNNRSSQYAKFIENIHVLCLK